MLKDKVSQADVNFYRIATIGKKINKPDGLGGHRPFVWPALGCYSETVVATVRRNEPHKTR